MFSWPLLWLLLHASGDLGRDARAEIGCRSLESLVPCNTGLKVKFKELRSLRMFIITEAGCYKCTERHRLDRNTKNSNLEGGCDHCYPTTIHFIGQHSSCLLCKSFIILWNSLFKDNTEWDTPSATFVPGDFLLAGRTNTTGRHNGL